MHSAMETTAAAMAASTFVPINTSRTNGVLLRLLLSLAARRIRRCNVARPFRRCPCGRFHDCRHAYYWLVAFWCGHAQNGSSSVCWRSAASRVRIDTGFAWFETWIVFIVGRLSNRIAPDVLSAWILRDFVVIGILASEVPISCHLVYYCFRIMKLTVWMAVGYCVLPYVHCFLFEKFHTD